MNEIGVLAGDLRQHFIYEALKKNNINVAYLYDFKKMDEYIIPIPFTKDKTTINAMLKRRISIEDFLISLPNGCTIYSGNIPQYFIDKANEKNISCVDILKDSNLAWENAYLTAEGLLSEIISSAPFSLKNSNVMIIGFGKCGSNIGNLLKPLCEKVFFYDHTDNNRSRLSSYGFKSIKYNEISDYIPKMNIVINTVPKNVLSEEHLSHASSTAIFYEIASYPFGFHKDVFDEHNLRLVTCPGLPGKYSPKSAGEIISESILRYKERVKKDES